MKDDQVKESTSSSSSVVVVSENSSDDSDTQKSEFPAEEAEKGEENEDKQKQQEVDWKTDEEFKRFMGNPSIEAAIKLEKKRADRKLKDLDRETSGNPLVGLFNRALRDSLTREKEMLEKAEETFKAIDLDKVTFSIVNPLFILAKKKKILYLCLWFIVFYSSSKSKFFFLCNIIL